jgi:cytochrome P450
VKRFVPPHPPRGAGPVATWRGLVGERARTSVYGWSKLAFEADHLCRKVLGFTVHIPLTPEGVEHVLLANAANYAKVDVSKRILAPVIGLGLLTADGELWREQRKIVAASFSPPAVEQRRTLFSRAAEEGTAGWEDGTIRDMASEATNTTMRVIAESLFSGDPRLTSAEASAQILAALGGIGEQRVQVLLGLPMVPLSRRGWAARQGQRFLRTTLGRLVADRMEGRAPPDDFLGGLIKALNERFAPKQARSLAIDNAATFYLAGHETTANALSWTLYLLSESPELQDRLAEEARSALSHTDFAASPVSEQLPQLYAVLQESLRLYPPAPRFDRQAIGPDELYGATVEKGHIVSIWPWLLHRHRKLWDDPDAFDPERFLPCKPRPSRFQYLPFGAGPRVCVGAQFATVEALVILAHWLSAWRFEGIGHTAEPSGLVTLRPKGGVPLRLSERQIR